MKCQDTTFFKSSLATITIIRCKKTEQKVEAKIMLSGLSLSLKTQSELTTWASSGNFTSSHILLAIKVKILKLQISLYFLVSEKLIAIF